MYLVERTCTEVSTDGSNDQLHVYPQPLSYYRNLSAYVLLGDPGSGKTTAFDQAADREDAFYITARDLITFDNLPEWHGKTLFIDGLDEIRAGTLDARTPFDAIRARLEKLGRPSFRLSCREADWFGAGDQERLKSVSPDGHVTILHLDSLTEENITDILNHNSRIPNAKEFIQWAEQKGLNELLINPQILDMLVKVVADGNWPDSRKQTFELACQTIIQEHNQEHIDAKRAKHIDMNEQLNAAGFLCTVQLISGNSGYALSPDMESSEFPELSNSSFNNVDLLNEVSRTKLFTAPVEGRITPVHRHVAEYLAARYLNERIERNGLSISRIIALITGEDGVVVSELRGLSAWLAALCKSQRYSIIERDPLGVVLYGDVQDFTPQDKRHILNGLQREASRYTWFRSSNWTASPFGALSTPDMEKEFHKILTAPDRSETYQALSDCVLDAMRHGTKLLKLNDTLLKIVRDTTWWPRIRREAVEIILHYGEAKPDSITPIRILLDDINNGIVDDPDDELMGYLLTKLYTTIIPAEEILDYLHAPKHRNYIGSYRMFWDHKLVEQSSDSDTNILLDGLSLRMDALQPILDDHHLRDLTAGLLARGLEAHGESVEPERLYEWLRVSLNKYCHPHTSSEAYTKRIRTWLELHPEIQKTIISIGLERCAGEENFGYCMHKVRGRLFQAPLPEDFGQWCLDTIQIAYNDNVARYLLQEAVGTICYQRGNAGLSLEIIEDTLEPEPKHKTWLNEMLVCNVEQEMREHLVQQERRKAEDHQRKQEWLQHVKSNEIALRKGQAHPGLLHNLATAYFGLFIDSEGDTPIDRIRNFLDHNERLVQAVFEGIRSTLIRDDIPCVTDIIKLEAEGQTYLLSRPFLAGLTELTREESEDVLLLSNDQIKQAVAFYLIDGTGEEPNWYQVLLTSRPELVAEAMVTYVASALRNNKSHITGLYALAYIDSYSSVSRLVSISLLKSFPVRSTNQQAIFLDEIMKAALRYADRQELLALLEKKLSLNSMNISQRIRWLAVGLITDPDKYIEPLEEFSNKQEKRVQHLANFFSDRHDQWSPLDGLPVSAIELLIRLIGIFFAPYSPGRGKASWVTPAMNAADFVSHLIKRLGSQPLEDATSILDDLLDNNELSRWHSELSGAQFEQRAVRREASFQHPNIQQISKTLNNSSPSNAGDLAALTIDILHDMADRIRNGNTDDYRQFWNEGPQRQLTSSKHEDACRDALLSDLQQRLEPLGIDAHPEAHYADDKRADIRMVFGGTEGFEVPIEIKKNTHTNLWHAIHEQLIKKYTRAPNAHGFGIYLVFWFGPNVTQPPPSGPRPRTAYELEVRLGEALSTDENRKISICVIDVAKPE